jgi:hypothetical protein
MLCDSIVETGRRRPWWLQGRFSGSGHRKVSFWHDPAHVLVGTIWGRQPKAFGAFLTHSRPSAQKRMGVRFDRGRSPASDSYLTKFGSYQLVQQSLGVFQHRRVEAFGEPAVDWHE